MIIELKSATGSVRNGQMRIEWIRNNLTPSFKIILQGVYKKIYYIILVVLLIGFFKFIAVENIIFKITKVKNTLLKTLL